MGDTVVQEDAGQGADTALDETTTFSGDTKIEGRGRGEVLPTQQRGETLGRYVILDLLGRGGMGEVYAAYDPELDRKVAVKVIHARGRAGDPESARLRLLREAQTMARLSHPNVVAVYDVGELDGDVYVAMEFVAGTDIGEWLRAEERSTEEILEVYLAAAAGLGAAHQAGLVHRDFKPENVLIGSDGRVRVIDFGIARPSAEPDVDGEGAAGDRRSVFDALIDELSASRKISSSFETRDGALVGTPAYMAPEQFLGGAADARTDQFAFCITLWEAVCGERPFPGDNVADLSAAVLDDERRPPPASVPANIAAALIRGLSIERDGRFASMDELIEALTPPPQRRSRALAIGATALTAAAVTALAVAGLGGSSAPDPCAGIGDQAAAVWSPERRAAAEKAFRAAGDANAAATWERVSRRLDAYASRWSVARRDVCEAGQVRHEQSVELSEKRVACLDERLGELRAVVALVENARPSFLDNAVETADGLGRIDDCSNVSRLAGAPSIPTELASEIAKLRALERAGDYRGGLAASREALEHARAQGSEAGEARALLWLGHHQCRLGKREAGIDSYFDAIRTADDAGDTRTEAEAWIELVKTVGARMHRYHDGERWAKHAALAIRQDGSSLELEARLHYHLGSLRSAQSRDREALAEYRQAEELARKALGSDSLPVLMARQGIAGALRGLGKNREAVEMGRELLAARRRRYGADHIELSGAESSLASSLAAIKEYDEARKHYLRAVALRTEHLGPDHPSLAYTMRDFGRLEERIGDFDAALKRYQRALELRRLNLEEPNVRVFQAMARIARIQRKRGDLRAALRQQSRAVRGLRQLADDARPELGRALGELCDLHRRAGALDEARGECEVAITILESSKGDPRELATVLTRAARVDLEAGRAKSARERAERALAIRREHPGEAADLVETLYALARPLAAEPEGRDRAAELLAEIDRLSGELNPGDDHLEKPIAALRAALKK